MITNMPTFLTAISIISTFVPSFFELVLLSLMNLVFVYIIVHFIYDSSDKTRDYEFSYILISATVFFLCFMLGHVELQLGFALGLFAIFGIIRYRTDAIPIKEMTYLFLVIGISVINALARSELSIWEIGFTNVAFVIITVILEKSWRKEQFIKRKITYERIDLIKPENKEAFLEDLRARTGLNIERFEIQNVDFLKDTADIVVYARKNI